MYETSDLAFAAFLMLEGFMLKSAEKISGRYSFKFNDPQGLASGLEIQFLNSNFMKFDNNIRTLRSIIRD